MRGFTLLELLVALAIFALLSVMAYGGLRNVLDTRAHVTAEMARLATLQTAFTLMERDIEQALARSVRDNYGDVRPALAGGSNSDALVLELTHAGYRNPSARPRSQLQRVAYQLQDGKLQRLLWPVLDRAPVTEPVVTELLADVSAVQVLFYDQQLVAQPAWPVTIASDATSRSLPRAMEVSIEFVGWGRVTRLFRMVDAPI